MGYYGIYGSCELQTVYFVGMLYFIKKNIMQQFTGILNYMEKLYFMTHECSFYSLETCTDSVYHEIITNDSSCHECDYLQVNTLFDHDGQLKSLTRHFIQYE